MDDDNAAGEVGKGASAIPIDVCFQSSSVGPKVYTKYTCAPDGLSVNKTKYSDGSCSRQKGSVDTFNRSSAASECGLYTFNCDGDDAFIVTGAYYETFSNDDDCSSLQSMVPTALGCFCTSNATSYSLSGSFFVFTAKFSCF